MAEPPDYDRVARAIRFLAENRLDQPTLADVAAHLGLSPFHFERLFIRWAGVSPKKFLGFLTKEHARSLLAARHSVLDAALDCGLSGPGRLHDLLVTWEGGTPGQLKSCGEGMTIRAGRADSPFGPMTIGVSERGICSLHFGPDHQAVVHDWPGAIVRPDDRMAATMAERIFGPPQPAASGLRVFVRGTAFQHAVWQALLRIPDGAVTTYRDIARSIGQASAVRAVGGAVGANPVAWLIPCHRVLRASGELGGYRWGPDRKVAMLFRESVTPNTRSPNTAGLPRGSSAD
jgi:AraC family transcriptional regulator, regulatory protein of adaptative response / methylated-DNA-[protein]-cysteine methyltransferase